MDAQDTDHDTNGSADQVASGEDSSNGMADENVNPNVDKRKEYKDGESITVFHDPENFNVKHPLMHEWTLWFTKPPSGKVCRPLDQLTCNITSLPPIG
jgi:hypothetical protein